MEIKKPDKFKKNKEKFHFEIKVLLSMFGLLMLFFLLVLITKINRLDLNLPDFSFAKFKYSVVGEVKKFSTEQDFKNYLDASQKLTGEYGGGVNTFSMMDQSLSPSVMMEKSAMVGIGGGGAPDRVSATNVQVVGIDEPDIVKTNGKEIYFSGTQQFYPMMRGIEGVGGVRSNSEKMIAPYPYSIPQGKTNIIKAFPPEDLALEGKIDKQGDLLLEKNILIVFPSLKYGNYGAKQEIAGYDVADPKSPIKKWTIKLDADTSVVASRLNNGKVYLITKNNINASRPCPIKPLSVDNIDLNIKCADIYHPIVPVPTDSTFVAMALDPNSGKIENTVSFVGSSGSSIVYVSEKAIYVTYIYNESIAKFFSGFVQENKDIFSSLLVEKVVRLEGYDISQNSKLQEITMLIEKYSNSLDSDERLKMENEMQNRMNAYYKKNSRNLEKTGIVKIALDKFQVVSSGTVPGHLLNNFAMDEYKENLRVASTIGSRWGIFNGVGSGESVSDVTILDKNLRVLGSVQDLGKTEQIYSVRFIEDKGYVVTFRQTDPFYVLDLANPKKPVLAGELKIPGYSSYLHPLDATHILGIGQEGSQVKISLFDVTDKTDPIELDKYLLDEHWTEVSNNYHAFLLDTKHKIFFLPGSKGGYVFSYFNPEQSNPDSIYMLKLKKAVSQNSVKRAIYLDDYLYIIGEGGIGVLNESDWKKVNELDLSEE